MGSVSQRLRQLATVSVAVGAVTAAVGIAPAHASTFYNDKFCGANVAVDGVYTRGCWYEVQGAESRTVGYRLGAKLRIPSPMDPVKWSACEIRAALFEKPRNATSFQRVTTTYGDCLTAFQANSQNNTAFRFASDFWYMPPPGAEAYVMVRWFGKYGGQSVGMSASGPFAYSLTGYGDYTGVATVDNSVTQTPTIPDAPALLLAPDVE